MFRRSEWELPKPHGACSHQGWILPSCRCPPAQALLTLGGDARALDADGNTPLHSLVRYFKPDREAKYLEAARALLAAGCSPATANREGVTPQVCMWQAELRKALSA